MKTNKAFLFKFYTYKTMTFCSFSNEKSTRLLHEIICPPAAIERGVMQVCYPCDIFISVKVSLLLSFQKSEYQLLKKTEKQWHLI
jgi:hypothetical protein